MSSQRADINRIFRALGDPSRRSIVEKLSDGPVSVTQLSVPLEISVAAVVQHLQVLEQSGLVTTEKVGRVRLCRIDHAGLALVEQWIVDRRASWEQRLERLGRVLAAQDVK